MRSKMKLCFMGWGNSIHMQRWMRWFVNSGHEVYLITDYPSNMPGITEHDISDDGEHSGGRIRRYLSLRFNVYFLRSLVRKSKVDLLRQIINVWKSQWSYIRKYAVRHGLAKADLITVDSDELRVKTMQYGNYEDKTEYISFGVDTKLFYPGGAGSSGLKKRLRIAPNAPLILSNRSLEDLYNIDVIIKAIPSILGVFPKTIFVFAWHSASRKDYLMKLAESLGVMDNVRFIGKVRHEELPEYYAASDVFVTIPAGDTISISLLEAMACGVAPVVSDLPSSRECIRDGVNGCIVPVRDVEATAQAIIKLLGDGHLRETMVQRNREWVMDNADWDGNMKKVEQLY